MAGPHGTPPALETAMAKTAANLAAKFVCDEAIQLLGGYGFSREYPVERVYRDIRGLCIGAGTVEIQRNFVGTQRAARRDAGQRRLEAPPRLTRARRRRSHPRARPSTAEPGGAWDRPTLDALLDRRRAAPRSRAAVARVAGGLRAAGVEPGDAVAWQAPNRPEVVARSTARAGGSARSRRRSTTRPGADEVARALGGRPTDVSCVDLDALPTRRAGHRAAGPNREQLAAVLWTSGSSGAPKGVLHTQATLAYKAAHDGPARTGSARTTACSCRRRARTSAAC